MIDLDDYGLLVRDRAVYVTTADTLVLADLHLGRETTKEFQFPIREREHLLSRMNELLSFFQPTTVVVAGDVLHAYSWLPHAAPESLTAIRELVNTAGASLQLVTGNHDHFLSAIPDVECVPEYGLSDGSTVICHGHTPPTMPAETYIIGHDHPAIIIEGSRKPCFLFGTAVYRESNVLVLPAFTWFAAGTPINSLRNGMAQSPLLAKLDAFSPIIYDDAQQEGLVFPPLDELRTFL